MAFSFVSIQADPDISIDAEPIPYPFFWMHAPKTGSTFGGVLAAALCRGLDRVDDFYHPHLSPWDQNVTPSLKFRHYGATMVPFSNATAADLDSKRWIRRRALNCTLRPQSNSGFRYGTTRPPNGHSKQRSTIRKSFSLEDEGPLSFSGPGFAHGHRPVAGHLPVVTMIREPSARAVSQFHMGLMIVCHIFSLPSYRNRQNVDCITQKDVSFSQNSVQKHGKKTTKCESVARIAAWANMEGVKGCQTKMLLGRPCSSSAPLSSADVAKAVAMIENPNRVAFVGDTDLWNLSVCAFWARVTAAAEAVEETSKVPLPDRPVTPISSIAKCPPGPLMARVELMHGHGIPLTTNVSELLRNRRAGSTYLEEQRCDSEIDYIAKNVHDAADEAVYFAMRRRLAETVDRHRERIESCSVCPQI